MFCNIGEKIKNMAQISCWIGVFFSVILGVLLCASGMENMWVIGIVLMIIGFFVSWGGSLLIYGFGVLVQNSGDHPYTKLIVKDETIAKVCSACGAEFPADCSFCEKCGGELVIKETLQCETSQLLPGKVCPNCGEAFAADNLFCTECGTELIESVSSPQNNDGEGMFCIGCGERISIKMNFCESCGLKIEKSV